VSGGPRRSHHDAPTLGSWSGSSRLPGTVQAEIDRQVRAASAAADNEVLAVWRQHEPFASQGGLHCEARECDWVESSDVSFVDHQVEAVTAFLVERARQGRGL